MKITSTLFATMIKSVIFNSTEARIAKSTIYPSFHLSTTLCFNGNDFNLSTIFVIKWLPAIEHRPNWVFVNMSRMKHNSSEPRWNSKFKIACFHLSHLPRLRQLRSSIMHILTFSPWNTNQRSFTEQ